MEPDSYPYAYLVTAPRFLGYSFNPVSFWYLYSVEKELKAMILEVNNTFDERRIYFLPGSKLDDDVEITLQNNRIDKSRNEFESTQNPRLDSPTKAPQRFTGKWLKDFHVSPFNSRKGSYSLVANDPLSPLTTGQGPIGTTITLNSSGSHTKLVARIFSTGPAVDPAQLNTWSSIRFVLSWCWVGFMTSPRILNEAAKLFFHKKLHVWNRPEVAKGSMERRSTSLER